jgi:hypothetical protein
MVMRCHRGFVQLALEHGACLVPCFTFGDNDLGLRALHQDPLSLGWLFKAITGIWLPRVLPAARSCAITTVVGEAIPLPRRGEGHASEAEITKYQASSHMPVPPSRLHAEHKSSRNSLASVQEEYIDALKILYAANVKLYGGPNAAKELEIVE